MARKPKYRRHSVRDLGFVEHDGKRRYFTGSYDSPESLAEYREFLKSIGFLVAEHGHKPESAVKLGMLMDRFIKWAEATYPSGRHSYVANLANAQRLLLEFTEPLTLAVEFTPLKLKAFQQMLIGKELARRTINDAVSHIRFMFKWGVSEELIPVTAYQSLLTVQGLKMGRTAAKEPAPQKPVPPQHVKTTLPKLAPAVRAMVQFQSLTGVRSQSVCNARPAQFDRSAQPWIWRPKHKTEFRGHVLTIFVGPKAQKIIGPFLKGKAADEFLFQPRNKAGNRSRRYRSFYDSDSYRTAIRRAAKLAGVPHWNPHRLRHSLGTVVREKHGLEAAQAVLGHVRIDATQIYAQRQLALAKMVARTMG